MKTIKIRIIKMTIVFMAILFVSVLSAQEQQLSPPPSPVNGYGIGIIGSNSILLQYLWGNENRLFRLRGNAGANFATENSSPGTSVTYTPFNYNFGLNFSILKIKSISEKFGLMYGGVFGLIYNLNQSDNVQSYYGGGTSIQKLNYQTLQPYAGIVLGAVYKVNASLSITAEIDPNVFYEYTHITNAITPGPYININGFGLQDFSYSVASVSLIYRIKKKDLVQSDYYEKRKVQP